MAVFDLARLLSSKRSQSLEEHAACRDLARVWCGLISDAAALHERLAPPGGRVRGRDLQDADQPSS